MQMSRDLFRGLLKSPNQATSDRRDRRQYARLSVVAKTTVMRLQPDGKSIALGAAIKDVASRGEGPMLIERGQPKAESWSPVVAEKRRRIA